MDANVARHLIRDVDGFVAVENLFDRTYDVSVSGSSAAPLVSLGIPRTLAVGVDVAHY